MKHLQYEMKADLCKRDNRPLSVFVLQTDLEGHTFSTNVFRQNFARGFSNCGDTNPYNIPKTAVTISLSALVFFACFAFSTKCKRNSNLGTSVMRGIHRGN